MTTALEQFDPFETYLALKAKYPQAFFFQVNDDGNAKLTLIGLRPYEVICASDHEDVLSHLARRLKENHKEAVNFPYEFGGAFGCLGHEIVKFIEPSLKDSGYMKEMKDVEAQVYLVKELIVFDHLKKLIHFTKECSAGVTDLRVRVSSPYQYNKVQECDPSLFEPHLSQAVFTKGVAKIKEHIKQGDIFQAVLSERFERKIVSSPLQIFSKLRTAHVSAYSFYFDFKTSSFFGSSPESLLNIHNNVMETHPIAGTRPRGYTVADDKLQENQLKRSVKEAAEHLMLVDLSRNDLGRVAVPGSVEVKGFRTLLKLPHVMHLVSIVTGVKRSGLSALDAFKASFPAGTLSGAPKIRAMDIIANIETRPRGFYGGAVVAFDFGGNLESCIAIRSVEVKDQTAILRAGAGIVADSRAYKEYEEILHKCKSLMMVIDASECEVLSCEKEMA